MFKHGKHIENDCRFCYNAYIRVLLFFTFAVIFSLGISSFAAADITVILDAGHGGIDTGTSGEDGTPEKEINLSIAKNTEIICQMMGIPTVMTRQNDQLISDPKLPTIRQQKRQDLELRLDMTRRYDPCLLVSIHQNWFSDPSVRGMQVFYSTNHPKSNILAEALQKESANQLHQQIQRQIKPVGSEIYLLYHANCPAVMIECGFMSNPEELSLLKNQEYRVKMAFCIVSGLLSYI